MKNPHVGVRIARCVRNAEHALDDAILMSSALVAAMIEGRRDAGLAAEVGQGALEQVIGNLQHLTGARGCLVQGHSALATAADDQGIGWRMEGPLETKTTGRLVEAA